MPNPTQPMNEEELHNQLLKVHQASMLTVSEQIARFINGGMTEKVELANMFANMAEAMTETLEPIILADRNAAVREAQDSEARVTINTIHALGFVTDKQRDALLHARGVQSQLNAKEEE